jgi:hypothetical protein
MQHYGRDYGRSRPETRGGYDMQYGGERRFIAQSRRIQDAPFRGGEQAYRGGYDMDLGAPEARRRQMREEQRFQQERAAPGENLGWGRGQAYRGYPQPFNLGRRRNPGDW